MNVFFFFMQSTIPIPTLIYCRPGDLVSLNIVAGKFLDGIGIAETCVLMVRNTFLICSMNDRPRNNDLFEAMKTSRAALKRL